MAIFQGCAVATVWDDYSKSHMRGNYNGFCMLLVMLLLQASKSLIQNIKLRVKQTTSIS